MMTVQTQLLPTMLVYHMQLVQLLICTSRKCAEKERQAAGSRD